MSIEEWIMAQIKKVLDPSFFGKLTLQVEAGRITTIKREETLKPPNLVGNRR